MSTQKPSSKQIELRVCLGKANYAVDLAVKELVKTRGGQVVERGNEWQFLVALSRETSAERLRAELEKYLTRSRGGNYHFKESSREEIVGSIRPVDLIISGHFTSETLERFVVVDLKGDIFDQSDSRFGEPVRFEAWCRLYYLPESRQWFIHYVDIIIRHKYPAQRSLFMFQHEKSGDRNPCVAEERAPDRLCKFFESPQGGMWG